MIFVHAERGSTIMPRLIDADALAFDVMGLTIVSPEVVNYANAVTVAIAKAPTIEAEPVVHCKDCKSFKEYTFEFRISKR